MGEEGEGEEGRGREESELENPSEGSAHHITGVVDAGLESSVCTRSPALITQSHCCSLYQLLTVPVCKLSDLRV